MRRILTALLFTVLTACAVAPGKDAAATASAAVAADPSPPGTAPRDSREWEHTVQAWEAQDARVRRMPGAVVFVGSSSIRLWATLSEDFPGTITINRGYGSSRVYDSVYFADRIVNAYQPRAVVFYAGENDLNEGRTPRQVRDDFVAFVRRVQAGTPKARIAFISIKPSPSRSALLPQVRQANALIHDYIRGARGVDYLDVFTPMLDPAGQSRPELFVADRLHMNAEGYAIWTRVVGAWLDKL
ncbi:SGNH/GDSL hydrolase family protein [Lysobacter sp. TAB13]|uniref:SGNH/GDSL hydrolase family protein n=1 Tax=Lysobacter sp. TAB13 TaxID=3233065 RepID=UPI003F95CE42